jgi:hypothetical protein
MPKLARGGDLDLDEAYGPLLDMNALMRRNIRTKTDINRNHHCEDKECGGGAPKAKCITKLHFAFCLAPVVDQDADSPAYGKVVIHGERFAVISPPGCAEHPYRAEYNLDLKDARNGRANYEIRWKKTFAAFQEERKLKLASEATKTEEMRKKTNMTAHQLQSMRARQDRMEYQRQRKAEIAATTRDILEGNVDHNSAMRHEDSSPNVLSAQSSN